MNPKYRFNSFRLRLTDEAASIYVEIVKALALPDGYNSGDIRGRLKTERIMMIRKQAYYLFCLYTDDKYDLEDMAELINRDRSSMYYLRLTGRNDYLNDSETRAIVDARIQSLGFEMRQRLAALLHKEYTSNQNYRKLWKSNLKKQ